MRAFVVRELIVIARRPALVVVIAVYTSLLAAFVLLWNGGVPVLAGSNVYEQQRLFAWTVLAALLPWLAVRCLAPDRDNRLVIACALAAVHPSTIVIGKGIGLAAALSLVVLAGFPATIIAQQMSAVPLATALRDLIWLFGLAVLAAAVTIVWVFAIRDRLGAWVGASGSMGLGLAVWSHWSPAGLPAGLTAAFVGAALTAALASWSDNSLRYCDE